ncbi:PREDICTED: leucine zipper protein 1-like [Nicrophorus vespilloides]|uniref:Leucine zipper protein 1-like n=1 Tax=Nicrophorus vespilloides TaxID=110193 RepID=A0ABM1MG22_NICVS|nr:PREDICTED: leucine zipper protein 1-like [Nicrophorus vespilloides]
MERTVNSRSLFEQLFVLEKDYNHHLALIKSKDEEIERCNNAKARLENSAEQNLVEMKQLKSEIRNLQERLNDANREREHEKKICEDVINSLTVKLQQIKRKHATELEEGENELRRRCNELEDMHTKNINEIDNKYKKTINDLESDVQRQTSTVEKLRRQLKSLMQDNMILRNNARELESQYLPEITIYKEELKTMRSSNASLSSEIEFLRKEFGSRDVNFARIKSENGQLRGDLELKTNQITHCIQEKAKVEDSNTKLSAQIRDLISRCSGLTECKKRMEVRISELVDVVQNRGAQETTALDQISKQNALLRETVKSMRAERETIISKGQIDARETERRIEGLEQLMEELKEALGGGDASK